MIAVSEGFDVESAARHIARAADADSKGTGRPCRLQDPSAVRVFLMSLWKGRSRTAAAGAAGFSEGAVRRWLKVRSTSGTGDVYATLQAAVAAIPLARQAAAVSAPALPTRPVAPALPPAPVVPPASIHRWKALSDRAAILAQRGPEWQLEGRNLVQQMRYEMQADGFTLTAIRLPAVLPCLRLPRTLSHSQIQTAYIQWCQDTLRPGPTDIQLEMECTRWYREHREPDEPKED